METIDKIAKQNSVAMQVLASDVARQLSAIQDVGLSKREFAERLLTGLHWKVFWEFGQDPLHPVLKLCKA